MLKKINKLRTRKEIEEVKNKGGWRQGELAGWLKIKSEDGKKFAVVVSKKVAGKAVERNRIRRVLYEAIRKRLGEFEEGVRFLGLVKKRAVGAKSDKANEEIEKIIEWK